MKLSVKIVCHAVRTACFETFDARLYTGVTDMKTHPPTVVFAGTGTPDLSDILVVMLLSYICVSYCSESGLNALSSFAVKFP